MKMLILPPPPPMRALHDTMPAAVAYYDAMPIF